MIEKVDVGAIDPGKLLEYARGVVRARHWVLMARIIGRINAEKLWLNTDHKRAVDLVEAELGMNRSEYFDHARLYKLIEKAPTLEWERLRRTQASRIRKLVGLGDDPVKLFRVALAAPDDLKRRAEKNLQGEEKWVRLSFRVPDSIQEMWNQALAEAKMYLDAGDDVNADDPGVTHRLLEVILVHFLQRSE